MRKIVYLSLFIVLLAGSAMRATAQSAQTEYDAYTAFYNQQNPAMKADLGEKFLNEPTLFASQYRKDVVTGVIRAYTNAKNWAKVMETVDKLGTLLPTADDKLKLSAYQQATDAAIQADNFAKIIDYGDKTLQVDPNDLNAQITVSRTLVEKLPADEAQKKAALDKAFGLATKARAQIPVIFDKAPPSGVTPQQWSAARIEYDNQISATIALVHFNRKDYEKAIEEYEKLVKGNPKDDISQYYLGLSYNSLAAAGSNATIDAYNAENKAKTDKADQFLIEELGAKREAIESDFRVKRDKGIDALAKAVAIGGGIAGPARTALEKLYATKTNGDMSGLNDLINSKKAELGLK